MVLLDAEPFLGHDWRLSARKPRRACPHVEPGFIRHPPICRDPKSIKLHSCPLRQVVGEYLPLNQTAEKPWLRWAWVKIASSS
jgi:hypothetical protein